MNEKKKSFFSSITNFKDVDMLIFIPIVVFFAAFIAWGLIAPDSMNGIMSGFLNFFTGKLGTIFLVVTFGFFVFELFIAFSKYGNIRIGADDDKPEHSYFTWFCMLFAACYGSGLTFWAVSEPLTFVATPIFSDIEPYSAAAAETGLAAAYNHWGPLPWTYTLICSMAVGYFVYRKNMSPRYSLGLYGLIGKKYYGNWVCRLIDMVLTLAAMCAGATMFGFAVNQFAAGLHEALGIPVTNSVRILSLAASVAVFTWSCLSGVKKGIAFLSRLNIRFCIFLMVVCFGLGPTLFQMDMGVHAFGEFMNNFFALNFNTDPITQSGIPQAWTMFYWAWWISSAAQIGLFVASISRGRTMREMIIGLLVVAPLGTFVWFAVFGGGGIYQQYFGGKDLVSVVLNQGPEYGTFAYLETLPLAQILMIAYLLLGFIFLVTSGDSAVFSWSQATMKRTYNHVEPAKSIRFVYCMIWFVSCAILLLNVENSMSAIQAAGVSISVPCLIIFTMYCVSFYKAVKSDTPVSRAELNAQGVAVGRDEVTEEK